MQVFSEKPATKSKKHKKNIRRKDKRKLLRLKLVIPWKKKAKKKRRRKNIF